MGIVSEKLFKCTICGNLRGDACPTCIRDFFMSYIKDWKNSDAFKNLIDKEFNGGAFGKETGL